jgi:hypothetical protein
VVIYLLRNTLIGDPDNRFQVIGVPPVAQKHAAVGAVRAVFQPHLLALSFLQAHRYSCRYSG